MKSQRIPEQGTQFTKILTMPYTTFKKEGGNGDKYLLKTDG